MSNAVDSELKSESRRFRAYSTYKESGVEWLGRIPEGWEVSPLYARYDVKLGKMLDSGRFTGQFRGSYLRNTDVQWDRVNVSDLHEMDFAPSERERYLLRAGDLLVCEGGEVGRTAIWQGELAECFYQKALHRVRPLSSREHPRFLFWIMRMVADRGVFSGTANQNTIDHLTATQLRHYRFPFPTHAEQRAIAVFLDWETARIDALVAKKERLITLLQERRTALITRAVTEGSATAREFRAIDSIVFPKVPTDWPLVKLRRLLHQVFRPVQVTSEGEYREIGIRSWGRGIFHKDPVKGALLDEKSIFSVVPGDFVLNIVFAWEGAAAIVSENERGMVGSHRFPTFRIDPSVLPDYLLMVLQTAQGRSLMEVNSPGAAGRNRTIRLDQFLAEEIPLPPINEQATIVQRFRSEESLLARLAARTADAISHLHELRIALISAAVTGKIDVREAAQ